MSESVTLLTRPDQTRPDQTRPDQPYALISVIVPAYNVEKYIARCLDSLLAQTYTNLEILVIDDGSTDSTGTIADQYALRDPRIRVIHQENQGAAEARNIGIREAKGEYIQIVDGDDWIDPETIETCYKYLHEYNADIVTFCFVYEREDGTQKHLLRLSPEPKLMTNPEAVCLTFFHAYVGTSSCDKLFKAELFRGITYPRGKVFEDTHATYKVVDRASRVLSISNEFHHYFMRNGSITHREFSGSEMDYDNSEATLQCVDYITGHYDLNREDYRNLCVGSWIWRFSTVNKMIKTGKLNKQYISQLKKDIKPLEVLRCRYVEFIMKAQLIVFKYSLKLYSFIYLNFRRDKS